MKILTLFLAFIALEIVPTNVLAKLGVLFPEPEDYGRGVRLYDNIGELLGKIGGVIVITLIVGWFYSTLIQDYVNWKNRRKNKESFNSELFKSFFINLFIYSLRGIFLGIPFLFVTGWIGGGELVKEIWLYIFIGIIAIQFFLDS